MKIFKFLLFLAIFGSFSFANALYWSKTYGSKNDEFAYSIKESSDGAFIIAANTSVYGIRGIKSSNILLLKISKNKKVIWKKEIADKYYRYVTSMVITKRGNIIIVGKKSKHKHIDDNGDIFILKTNSSGTKLWEKTIGGEKDDFATSVSVTKDGGYVISAVTDSFGSGKYDIWVIKLNKRGNKVWGKHIGGRFDDYSESIITLEDGSYLVAGSVKKSANGDPYFLLLKISSKGKVIWKKTQNSAIKKLANLKNGQFVSIGSKNIFKDLIYNTYLTKYDKNGKKLWKRVLRGAYNAIEVTNNGEFILSGNSKSINSDILILKLNANGNKQWTSTIGGDKDDISSGVVATKNGDYLVVGNTDSFGRGRYDIWVVRFNEGWIKADIEKDKIFEYLKNDYKDLAKFLKTYKYDLNRVYHKGDNHLIYYMGVYLKDCSYEKIKLLVDKGLRIDKSFKGSLDGDWFAPMHLIASAPECKKDAPKILNLFLKSDLFIDKKAKYGRTALYEAVNALNFEAVEFLIKKGASAKTEDMFGNTLLHLLAKSDHDMETRIKIFELLFKKGLNINQKNRYENSPLVVAIDNESEKVALYLLKKKANFKVNYKKRVPLLTLAIIKKQNKIAKILIEKGVDLNIDTKRGKYNPLANAILYKNRDIFHHLLANDADVNVNIKLRNSSFPLIIGILNKRQLSKNKIILDRPKIEANSKSGFSTSNLPQLLGYLKRRSAEEIKALVKHGADVNRVGIVNGQKMTPLHVAIGRNNLPAVKILLSKGADKKPLYEIKNPDGTTIIDFAREQNFIRILKELGVEIK